MPTTLIYTENPQQELKKAWEAVSEARRLLDLSGSSTAMNYYQEAVGSWRVANWMRRGSSARWITGLQEELLGDYPADYERGMIVRLQGLVASDQGHQNEAETLLRLALERHEQRFESKAHPVSMVTRHMLADVLVLQGKLDEGESLLHRVAAFYSEDCDRYTNYRKAILQWSLGNLYGRQKRIPEADKAFLEAIVIQQAWAYPNVPAMDIAGTLEDYAARQRDWGRTLKAEDLAEQAAEIRVAYRNYLTQSENEIDELDEFEEYVNPGNENLTN